MDKRHRIGSEPHNRSTVLSVVWLCLFGVVLLVSALGSQIARAQTTITSSAYGASSVHAADLNGDGDTDVLFASKGSNFADPEIAWYKNDGAGNFESQEVISTDVDDPEDVYAADLNGDGHTDVLSASSADDKIAWYKNDGTGSFGSQQVITSSVDGVQSIHVTDLDGDGDLDVLSASSLDDTVAWYENDGTGSFSSQKVISSYADAVQSVYAADLDGDGDKDVLTAIYGDDEVRWYENQIGESGADSDGFGGGGRIEQYGDSPWSVYAADLDGDSDKDVIYAAGSGDYIAWYENDGTGSFGSKQVISSSTDFPVSVYAADLTGNGSPDVLSASSVDDKIAWYKNDGTGSFGDQQVISSTAGGASSVYATDLTGDSENDVLFSARDDDKIAWFENTSSTLPVELASFDATPDQEKVRLTWQTASETGNAGFRIQRREGTTEKGAEDEWEHVGQVDGHGTTTEAQSYRFTDRDLPYEADALTYRLKQVDTDGSVHYSDEVTVQRGVKKVQLLGTAPNPASQQATVHYALPEKEEVTVRLYDGLGRQVRTVANTSQEGRHEQTLDVSGLSSGIYLLRLQVEGEVKTQKFTVVR